VGRTKEFDEDQVLERATDLFWRQGYKATSVRDLVEATGVAESSLYNSFGGKRGLFLQAIRRYRTFLDGFLKRLQQYDPPIEGIRWFFGTIATGLAKQRDFRGCLITNTTIELAPHDVEIQAELRSIYQDVEDTFAKVLRKARTRGEFASRHSTTAMARYLTQNLEGMRVLAKSNPGPRALRGMADTTLSLLFDPELRPPRKRSRSGNRKKTLALQER
jgi:TetR/AcrR family transcriptional repressor of nem operon